MGFTLETTREIGKRTLLITAKGEYGRRGSYCGAPEDSYPDEPGEIHELTATDEDGTPVDLSLFFTTDEEMQKLEDALVEEAEQAANERMIDAMGEGAYGGWQ
jgi:hypothetical protein